MSLFPPGLPLLHGPDVTEPLARWAAMRIPHVGAAGFGPCWAVGITHGESVSAVVVFHDWQDTAGTVQLSCAADTWRGASRRLLYEILAVPFLGKLGAPVRKVFTVTPHTNTPALRFNERTGFKREAVLRHHYAHKVHAVISSVLEPEWRKLYGA